MCEIDKLNLYFIFKWHSWSSIWWKLTDH